VCLCVCVFVCLRLRFRLFASRAIWLLFRRVARIK
jgi:hypothetical protein